MSYYIIKKIQKNCGETKYEVYDGDTFIAEFSDENYARRMSVAERMLDVLYLIEDRLQDLVRENGDPNSYEEVLLNYIKEINEKRFADLEEM